MNVYICIKDFFCSHINKYINVNDYVYQYENITKVAIKGNLNQEINDKEQAEGIMDSLALTEFFSFVKNEAEDEAGGAMESSSCTIDVLAIPVEYVNNPVLNPATDRAYYPSVLYFESGFTVGGTSYKYICIHSGDVDAGGGLIIAGSQDFKTWVQLNSGNPLVGLPSSAHHCTLVKLGSSSFQIYYWDSTKIYEAAAIRTAFSTDLINWTSDQPIQNGINPIITGGSGPNWNRGSYGPCDVIYNASASNTGTNPFDYSYAMYYDGTTGAFQSIGLAYSVDGITFNLYGLVLDHASTTWGLATPWDSSYTTAGKILETTLGKKLMFYSGGNNAGHNGVGAAISEDGLVWERLTTNNPLIGTVAGSWRDSRAYAISLVSDFTNRFSGAGDEVDVKMLVSGRDGGGDYTCGYFNIPYIYADVKELAYRLGKL